MPRSSMMSRGYGGQSVHVFSTGAVDGGFGNIVEQGVGFTIEDAMALQDGRHADGLGQDDSCRFRVDPETARLRVWR